MGFKLTIEEFLNGFAAGFVFLFGLSITNYKMLLQQIEILFQNRDFNISDSILILITVYIVGLAISAITNFLEQDFYLFFDRLIRKTYKKNAKKFIDKAINLLINKPLFYIKQITIFAFFRYWSTPETISQLNNKFKRLEVKEQELTRKYEEMQRSIENETSEDKKIELNNILKKIGIEKEKASEKNNDYKRRHSGLTYISGKTSEEIYTIDKEFEDGRKSFGRHYWYKSQFWQMCGNSILFIYLINLFLFNSLTLFSVNTIVYLVSFFFSKYMSPMYMKMQLRQISREYKAVHGREP